MATTSKLGYGNAENLDTAITNGIIDEKDLVITKDTSEFYYIRDDKSNTMMNNKADNLSYKNDMLQLTANGSPIGNAVEIKSSGGSGSGGDGTTDGNMRVVEF